MEIFELRYFLGVAEFENIHRASEKLNISPPSLSKAITRLEEELSVKLFFREGRNIQLTDQGKLLQLKASKIIQLEEAARIEISGHSGTLNVVIAGPEILLSHRGVSFCRQVKKKYPDSRFEFINANDEIAIDKVFKGEAHIALITTDIDSNFKSKNNNTKYGLCSKNFGEAKFQLYVGKSHPLFSVAEKGHILDIEEVLKYSFVGPSNPFFGKFSVNQSLDGWRDDKFLRKIEYLSPNLKVLEEIVVSGMSIAYLPDYFCENLKVVKLKISGCPYKCIQKIKLVARTPKDLGWLNQLF